MLAEPINTNKSAEFSPAVTPQTKERLPQNASLPRSSAAKKNEDIKLLQDVVAVAKEYFHLSDVGLDFSVHGETGIIKVSVTDKETGEVIREIPPEQVLNLMAKLDEMMGILFDQKA